MTQNKLRLCIGIGGISLVLLCTYLLLSFGGEYIDVKEYSLRHSAQMLTTALWPLLCVAVSERIDIGRKIGIRPFVCDFFVFNVISSGLIFLLEEVILKHRYLSADVVAEGYMYVSSVIIFMAGRLRTKKIKTDVYDILCAAVIIGVTLILWVHLQERIVSVLASLSHGREEIDADGEYINWISHRLSMLRASVNGDFSSVSEYRIKPMINGCSLVWLSSVLGCGVFAVVSGLCAALTALIFIYEKRSRSVTAYAVAICFALKLMTGIFANLFLIFSTTVGLPLVHNVYDLILLAVLIYESAPYSRKAKS